MDYGRKTKKELITEVAELRLKVDELESLRAKIGKGKPVPDACFDVVTGLPNRSVFYDHVQRAVAQAARKRLTAAVLFFSLDRFKLINDALGERAGDLLLKEVAERLKDCLRKSDILARPGRDEFMILLPDLVKVDDATVVVERIFDSLNAPFQFKERELFINGSIGISLYPQDGKDPALLIKNSYTAMMRAKEEGKNDFRFYSPNINSRAFRRLLMENSLRLALKREEITLHYQPQINLGNGRIIGMEALLRWKHPEMGAVSPEEFVPLMEEIGLTASLSEWVLQTACAHNRECQKNGFPPMSVAVNLSSNQLREKDLIPMVHRALLETGLAPEHLELEMTEGDMVRNIETTSATLTHLSNMGLQIAIDDFGKGYSCLSYLRHFPINRLKIDKTFVEAITTDHNNAAISTAIVALAHSLELGVIAEGVETLEQLDFLRALQCDAVQGYLFSRPIPAEDSLQLFTEKRNFDQRRPADETGCVADDLFWLERREPGTSPHPDPVPAPA
jgi:diguanylate cyclase (GGDEF)-like protein